MDRVNKMTGLQKTLESGFDRCDLLIPFRGYQDEILEFIRQYLL